MIIAKRKDLAEIGQMIAPYKRILILGCGTCTTVCSAGGPKECKELAESLVAGRGDLSVEQGMVPRQCSERFVERLEDKVRDFEAVLSMACGNGVQVMAKRFPDKPVLPALDTEFIGIEKEPGVWTEMCRACGDCILWRTAGICPVTRCAKGLLNGPCGGSREGRCEVSKDLPCAWQEIYQGLKRLGLTGYLKGDVQIKGRAVHPGRLTRVDEDPEHSLHGSRRL
jgi:ferredoxin